MRLYVVLISGAPFKVNQWEKTATEKQQLQTERTGLQSDEYRS
ncbi:unnamed protein product [Brassica rapa subsp. trilocularis]